jgi:hypothetical protein
MKENMHIICLQRRTKGENKGKKLLATAWL